MHPIRVGIAGLGRSGWNIHAAILAELPDLFRVTAVADPIPAYPEEARARFGAAAYPDYRAMLRAGGFDLWINALPTPLHVPATIEALAAGFHVVCEKPMAPTAAAYDRMVQASEVHDRRLFPFQNNRLQPFFEQMMAVVESGVLGRLVHVRSTWGGFRRRWDWQTRQENLGGSLFNTGPHAIDQALMLLGEPCTPQVFCRLACHHELGGDADDFCSLTLFDPQRQAPTIDILLTAHQQYPLPYMYYVSATAGSLVARHDEVRWSCFDPLRTPAPRFWPQWSENRAYPSETLDWTERIWSLEGPADGGAVGYTLRSLPGGPEQIYRNLHAVLRDRAELRITLSQVRRQIVILEECQRQNPLPKKPPPGPGNPSG